MTRTTVTPVASQALAPQAPAVSSATLKRIEQVTLGSGILGLIPTGTIALIGLINPLFVFIPAFVALSSVSMHLLAKQAFLKEFAASMQTARKALAENSLSKERISTLESLLRKHRPLLEQTEFQLLLQQLHDLKYRYHSKQLRHNLRIYSECPLTTACVFGIIENVRELQKIQPFLKNPDTTLIEQGKTAVSNACSKTHQSLEQAISFNEQNSINKKSSFLRELLAACKDLLEEVEYNMYFEPLATYRPLPKTSFAPLVVFEKSGDPTDDEIDALLDAANNAVREHEATKRQDKDEKASAQRIENQFAKTRKTFEELAASKPRNPPIAAPTRAVAAAPQPAAQKPRVTPAPKPEETKPAPQPQPRKFKGSPGPFTTVINFFKKLF